MSSSLLYNCETFGSKVAKQLEIVIILSSSAAWGSGPTQQINYYWSNLVFQLSNPSDIPDNILTSLNSSETWRKLRVKNGIQDSRCDFLNHYVNLLTAHRSEDDIKLHYSNKPTTEVRYLAQQKDKYKFQQYTHINPNFTPLDFH